MKTPLLAKETRAQRLEQASEWLLRLNDETHSEEDIAEWLRWCDSNPENVKDFERLQRDWNDLDVLRLDSLSDLRVPSPRPSPASRRGRIRWAIAAGIAALAVTTGFTGYYYFANRPVREVVADISNKSARLPDGSSIVLSAQTQVGVDFSETQRQLKLSQGEAYFKVSHDKQRPFVVHAGELDVKAIGTAFNVRREHDQVIVTVEEGIVEISSSSPNTWRAEAGYQLTYSLRDRTAILASVDPEDALKWRNGELSFVWQPLSAVVYDLNRYSQRKIVIQDPKLAQMQVTTTVFTAFVDDWLKAVQQAYPVHIEEAVNGDLLLTARE